MLSLNLNSYSWDIETAYLFSYSPIGLGQDTIPIDYFHNKAIMQWRLICQ